MKLPTDFIGLRRPGPGETLSMFALFTASAPGSNGIFEVGSFANAGVRDGLYGAMASNGSSPVVLQELDLYARRDC